MSEPTNSDLHKEIRDVGQALHTQVERLSAVMTNSVKGLQQGIDARTDTVLGRVAASEYSTSIVIGAAAVCVFIGWLI